MKAALNDGFFISETDYEVSTWNDYKYHYIIENGIDVRGQTSITVQVMACNDAHIALSKDWGVDSRDTYEIVIGGWGDHQSVIIGLLLSPPIYRNVNQLSFC